MTDLKAAVYCALKQHECGSNEQVAYVLSFAGTGNSGGSFGWLQHDCAVNPEASALLHHILISTPGFAFPADEIVSAVSRRVSKSPLTSMQQSAVDAAINAQRPLVDGLDNQTLDSLMDDISQVTAAASSAGRVLSPDAQIALALWANMTGYPATLQRWLTGADVTLDGVVIAPPVKGLIDANVIVGYLNKTAYFLRYPKSLAQLTASVETGVAELSHG